MAVMEGMVITTMDMVEIVIEENTNLVIMADKTSTNQMETINNCEKSL